MTANRVFLACNYSNKKVKGHFNKLREHLQKEWPIHVILIDKERGNASKDFWKQIRSEIDNCALAIFDVSAFRPNVVLELGYALAVKDEKQILITYDQRKPRTAKPPEWLLTDISHIHQVRYKQMEQMDDKIEENLENVPAVAAFKSLCDEARSTSIPDKYSGRRPSLRLLLNSTRRSSRVTTPRPRPALLDARPLSKPFRRR